MLRGRSPAFVFALALALGGCKDDPDPASTPTAPATTRTAPVPLPSLRPAALAPPPGSQTPNLSATPRGGLLLTWLEPAGEEQLALRLARRKATGWAEPVTVFAGTLLDNWADFPAAGALADGTLVVTWLERFADDHGYGIRWSRSTDDGATWSIPETLHEHTDGPEYGFVSMAPTPDGRLALFWLDGRASTAEGEGATQLRTAILGPQGPASERGLVDDRVCSCCQTSAAGTSKGPVVAYRNRSVEEVRDIHVAGPHPRLGEAVFDDGWHIAGCPVNGPSLGAQGEQLAIAWFSAPSDRAIVRAAFGRVGGDFSPPAQVDLGDPVGRVSLAMLDPTQAIVTFIERDGDLGEATIVARRLTAPAELGPPYQIARTTSGRDSGFPRSALVGDTIVWAFTAVAEGTSRVRIVEAPAAELR